MDFAGLELDYKYGPQNKNKYWWKTQKWNQKPKNMKKEERIRIVENGFSKVDTMVRISSCFKASFSWLRRVEILAPNPPCEICSQEMNMGAGTGFGERTAFKCR